MTIQVYRDIQCADGAAFIAEVMFRLYPNGWTHIASSTGSGGSRSVTTPASASALAATLRTGHYSWVAAQRGSRKISFQRSSAANPDYTSWRFEYTASGTLSDGTATSPDRHSTDTQYVSGHFFRPIAPAGDALKAHILVDDAGPSFAGITRRTPFPAGNNGFWAAIGLDECENPLWVSNPDPIVGFNVANGTNNADIQIVTTSGYSSAWRGYGTSNFSWLTTAGLENPGDVAGNSTADISGIDILYRARWVLGSGKGIIGTSRLFWLLQPGRTPVIGLDAGATRSHAAFWSVAVLNDGTALVS